jgi:NAD(P)H-hydrate repair Nnr-like enzyme with NAD(P)H-hydrate epimerase domain
MDKNVSEHATQIYLTAQIREFESIARQRFGFSNADMMKNAGQAALDYLVQEWPHAKKIAVICGSGNNGGDGYVLAHFASASG